MKDIVADDAALNALMAMGFSVTPGVVIDNEMVVGVDQGKLERLLGL